MQNKRQKLQEMLTDLPPEHLNGNRKEVPSLLSLDYLQP